MKKIILLPFFITSIFVSLFQLLATAQRVGIGTNNPDSTLDVRGNIKFGGVHKFLSYDSASGKISWTNSHLFLPNNQQLIQHSASAEGLFYNNSALEYRNQSGNSVFSTNWNTGTGYFGGNVGIGTTSPIAKLHIQSGISGFQYGFNNVIVETNSNNFISLHTPDNYQSGILFEKPAHLQSGGIYYNSPSAPDGFILRANNAPRMYISNNGNVGIGTFPQSRLHIFDGASGYAAGFFPGITFEGNGNRYLNFITPAGNESGILFGNNTNAAFGGLVYNSSGAANGLQFRTNGNIPRMQLNNSGYLGIGNTNPVYILDLNGRMRIRSSGASAGLWLNNNLNTEAAFIGMEDDTHVGLFGNNGAGWKLSMNTQSGALKVNGSEGQAAEVLSSNGTGNSASWQSLADLIPTFYIYNPPGNNQIVETLTADEYALPNATLNITITKPSRLIISATYSQTSNCPSFGGCSCRGIYYFKVNGVVITASYVYIAADGEANASVSLSNFFYDVNPGTYTFSFYTKKQWASTTYWARLSVATIIALPL